MINHSVPILAYHKVKDGFEFGINKVTIRAFQKQMQYLSENNYYTITFEDLISLNIEKTEKRRPVIISFDDADISVLSNAYPILHHYGFIATVFVISNFVGKINSWDYNFIYNQSMHLSWEDIIKLTDSNWEIASHSENHPNLKSLTDEKLFEELENSKNHISEKINQPVKFISYPFNKVDERIAAVAKQAGYLGGCGLSIKKKLADKLSEFAIQRIGVYSIDLLNNFSNKLSQSKFEIAKQRVISFCSNGTLLYKQLKR